MMVRELLRAPVSLESIRVTSDIWQEGQAPYALSPEFNPAVTSYSVTVPFETSELHFQGSPRLRAAVRYAADDGSESPDGVFAYTEIETRVFTLTAWEQYMDDTVYTITIIRESPQDALLDLRVWYDSTTNGTGIQQYEGRKGNFIGTLTEYEAEINAEANAVIVLALADDASSLTWAYGAGNDTPAPVAGTWLGTQLLNSQTYAQIRIPFPKSTDRTGTLTITTVRPGMLARTYILRLVRVKTRLQLETLEVQVRGPAGADWTATGNPLAVPFDPAQQNYDGEINKDTTGIWFKATLPTAAPAGSTVTYEIDPDAIFSDEAGGKMFDFALNKYTVKIITTSGDPELLDNWYYTVTITREGIYQIVKDPDAELRVRVRNSGNLEVENALPGTPLTLTVTSGLGYTINTVKVDDLTSGTVFHSASPNTTSYSHNFTMPAGHLKFTTTFTTIAPVTGVAYVAEDGWNDAGYDSAAHTADKWGTASKDLQAVINSWTGSNFQEIWIKGTVTPKSWAASVKDSTYKITPTADNKDKAFVIPPGLRLYGGFTGDETATGTIKANAANDPRDKTLNSTEDWRQRSILSGVMDSLNNTYHVVILADINYVALGNNSATTLLDGLTIAGGKALGSAVPISVKGYNISKQSGGGLYLVNANPVMNNVRVQGNTARNGGGMYNLAIGGSGKISSPWLTDVVIEDNSVLGNGSGGGMYNHAENSSSTCSPVFTQVTIRRNQTSGNGGGMYNNAAVNANAKLTMTDSVIDDNSAAFGGGLYSTGFCESTFTDVAITGNSAGVGGGGMFFGGTLPVKFTDVTVTGNSASYGGGILNDSPFLTITNADISNNYTVNEGGGINVRNGGAILTNVRLENNSAGTGGAVYTTVEANSEAQKRNIVVITNGIIRNNTARTNNGGGIRNNYTITGNNGQTDLVNHMTLTNVLIADNTAHNNGGGIHNHNSVAAGTANPGKGITLLMNNVTITNNTAETTYGGGIYTGGKYATEEATSMDSNKVTVTANNCIIWGNTAPVNTTYANIYNPTQSRTTLYSSLAQNGSYTDGGGNKTSSDFTGSYGPFAGYGGSAAPDSNYAIGTGAGTPTLINGGNTGKYPTTKEVFLAGALQDGRKTTFEGLIDTMVLTGSPPPIDNDAGSAVGNAAPVTSVRIQGGTIDVGAYEKQ
jgi:hypothetical protein